MTKASSLSPAPLERYLSTPSAAERELVLCFSEQAPLVIFDIGACEGEDSIRYGRHFPRARLFSFEPLPSNQKLIRTNFEKHQLKNAELIPFALSNTAGMSVFHVSSGTPQNLFSGEQWNYGNKSSSLLPPAETTPMHGWIEFKESITVPTTTLASFCQERDIRQIDFIHMDVQGAELMVLKGAGPMLKNTTAIWLEVADRTFYQGQPLRHDIQQFMRDQGFRLIFENSQHSEGDQFYVNLRHPRVWPWLIRRRCGAAAKYVRALGGRWKRRLFSA